MTPSQNKTKNSSFRETLTANVSYSFSSGGDSMINKKIRYSHKLYIVLHHEILGWTFPYKVKRVLCWPATANKTVYLTWPASQWKDIKASSCPQGKFSWNTLPQRARLFFFTGKLRSWPASTCYCQSNQHLVSWQPLKREEVQEIVSLRDHVTGEC